ncbi:MAG: hypothetical protein GY696_09960, partial [Gammaproteobacteria bacterium]|nr:hypothetical protein [Gammaproteobacteria bacterium]
MLTDQPMSAGLVRLLLLKAGIEPNPGPIYICPVCNVELRRNSRSVQCCRCSEWIHFRSQNNCSNLKSTTKKDYDKKTYVCPTCLNDPLTLHPTTSSPTQPSPTPATQYSSPPTSQPKLTLDNDNIDYNLKILQWNCNGIRSKNAELIPFIDENQIKVVVIQETKLSENSTPPVIPNFTLVRKDRRENGGGLAIFVHKSILFAQASDLPEDGHTESNGIQIGDIKIRNIYIPPIASCAPGFDPNFQAILSEPDSLILGDFNAHNPLWYSNIQDSRGEKLAEEIA